MELVMNGPSTSPYNDIKEKALEWFRSIPKFQRNIPTLQNELRTVILPAAIENHTLNVEVDDSGAITNPLSIECIRNKLIQWPGTDRISKLITRNQSTVDMITTELLNVKEGTYTSTNTAFTDGTECDVLYVPQSSNSPSLPRIIIEFQHTVTNAFMARAVQNCLNVFNRFHILPVLLIFCINKIESKALESQFTPKSDKPFYLETPSNHFAEFCYLVTKTQSIIGIDRWDDLTILKLYSIAKDVMDNGTNVDTAEGITALSTICKATHDQFAKISKNIASNPERAYRYSEAGRIYSENLKRKYDQLCESSTSDKSLTPMEEPTDTMNLSHGTQKPYVSSVVTFVENFKKSHVGRMNWSKCWEAGRKDFFQEYGNGGSLKAVYFKAIQKTEE
ncbi:hypothetical protein EDC94DRAFT_698095 [Helicostylum pulchrum]|nr:hypothetical protein EDC94DRAFT_698095 [Helicostylum pulchrum]